MLCRYIKCQSNGSNKNSSNHYVEVKAFDTLGQNRAKGKSIKYSAVNTSAMYDPTVVTDESTSTSPYFDNDAGEQYIILDLGNVYDIQYIVVWHYYGDGRIYNNVIFSVSIGGQVYTEIFNSDVEGTYAETSSGKRVYLPTDQNKYLIRVANTLYTIVDGVFTPLETTEVTAATFAEYGFDFLPTGTLSVDVEDPELLYWQASADDALPTIVATVVGTSQVPQIVTTNTIRNEHSSVKAISSITSESSDDVLYSVSFDEGVTWWAYDVDQAIWYSPEETAGMSRAVLRSITTEVWGILSTKTAIQIRFILPTLTSYLTSITINYTVS